MGANYEGAVEEEERHTRWGVLTRVGRDTPRLSTYRNATRARRVAGCTGRVGAHAGRRPAGAPVRRPAVKMSQYLLLHL